MPKNKKQTIIKSSIFLSVALFATIVYANISNANTNEDNNSITMAQVSNIDNSLQTNIKKVAKTTQEKLNADEVIVVAMNSKTGKVISLVSSNENNETNQLTNDCQNIPMKAFGYEFEPGDIMKPITIAMALDLNVTKKTDMFDAYNAGIADANGAYPRGSYPISEKFKIMDFGQFKTNRISVEDIVVHSSNIGTLQIGKKLKAREMIQGFESFGFTKPTMKDLSCERIGSLQSYSKMSYGENEGKDNIFKITASYGQGISANFMQLVKAYSVFDNNGVITNPQLYNIELNKSSNHLQGTKVISSSVANYMKSLLVKSYMTNTNQKKMDNGIKGLTMGGSAGVWLMVDESNQNHGASRYTNFFVGFVNDKSNNNYIIGVSIWNPKNTKQSYFEMSKTTLPLFKDVALELVKSGYLKAVK